MLNGIVLFAFYEEIRKCLEELQKQPSRDNFRKKCSKTMQHIYRKTPMPKYDFGRMLPIDHKKYQKVIMRALTPHEVFEQIRNK